MDKNPFTYLEHIFSAIVRMEDYLNGFDFESFSKDNKTIAATIREFEIIGEAASNISEDFKNEHSEIPWRKVIGVRNILIHDYMDVDLQIVWNIHKEYLPGLKKQIKKTLNDK